jgi:hypothetical protein
MTKPKVRIYDNGGQTYDRYTAVFIDEVYAMSGNNFPALGFSENPFDPQGFGQHCEVPRLNQYHHLGRRIKLSELPDDARKFVEQEYE